MDLDLKDKRAVVTGGSAGIGLAVARGLAREGVHVALCARNEERARASASSIHNTYGVEARAYRCDVTRPDEIRAAVDAVGADFGDVDILLSNAGEGTNENVLTADDARWQYYWDLHVMAAVRFARELVPAMRRRGGGAIIHNASICARQPMHHEPIYNVTKSALAMYSKCLAEEVIGDGIRVNCVNPGLTQTEAWENAAREAAGSDWKDHLERIAESKAPIGRFATPEELADFFVFLCSPRASYCVGSSYYVDGGWLNVVT